MKKLSIFLLSLLLFAGSLNPAYGATVKAGIAEANIDHVNIQSIGSTTHSTIDSYLDQAVKTSSSPSFTGATIGSLDGILRADSGVISAETFPIFSAYKTSDQTGVAHGTWTKVEFEGEDFDTTNDFDLSNERFTPSVAGKYLFLGAIRFRTIPDGVTLGLAIYKNGAGYKQGFFMPIGAADNPIITTAVIIEANGSTDYFEMFTRQVSGEDKTIWGASTMTYFQAFRLAE